MDRRRLLGLVIACGLTPVGHSAQAQAGASRSLTVLDFELVDDQNNPLTKAAQVVRLRNATAQLQRELAEQSLYRIVDPAPSQALQGRLREQQEFLYRCDDCAAQREN